MRTYDDFFDYVLDHVRKLFYPEELIKIDLTLSKTELLALLLISRREEAIMSEIAEIINVPISTATGLIERLVRKGYLVRARSESDRRIVVVRPTDKARELVDEVKRTVLRYVRLIDESLTEDERQLLFRIAMKVADALSREPEGRNADADEPDSGRLKSIPIE